MRLTGLFMLLALATAGGALAGTYPYSAAGGQPLARPDWWLMTSGDYWAQRYQATAKDGALLFRVPKDESGGNRGAWCWYAPAGKVITKVRFRWRYNADPRQFRACVFAGQRQDWGLHGNRVLWTADQGRGVFSAPQELTFPAGERMTGIGLGFDAAPGPIYRDWLAEFADVVIETAPVPPPAPLPGAVTIRDGHLWRDGQRLRLWGVNFCASVKQSYRDLPLCFDRLVDAGFNGVRINLFWGNFIDPKADNTYTVPVPVKGDGSQLDLLDYCVYLARQRGMVFWFSFDRREFKPADYDLLPDDGTRDEWNNLIKEDGAYSLVYLDRRAEKVFEAFARNVLGHVNPYTGLRYADDPAIALYEVFNENGFVDGLVNTGYKDKPVMARRVQQRWNEWLTARYGTDDRLCAAWGALAAGESLTAGTVAFAPVKNGVAGYAAGYQLVFKEPGRAGPVANYPARRGEDVVRFACDLSRGHTQRFTQAARRVGGRPGVGIRVAPITPTGVFNGSLPANYAGAGGDFVSMGMYGFACRPWEVDRKNPLFPFLARVNEPPMMEQPLDVMRPEDKPFLFYEVNDYRPNPYTVEFPLRMALAMALQDGDGVFWFNWDDVGYLPPLSSDRVYAESRLPMPDANYPNAGLLMANDEVALAAIKSAGTLFRGGAVAPAPRPLPVVLGGDRLFNPKDTVLGDLEGAIRQHAWREGTRIRYLPDGPSELPDARWNSSAERVIDQGLGVRFDWGAPPGGFISVDVPAARVYAGFTGGATVRIGDLQVEGLNRPFVYLALVAEDGRPLAQSKSILATLVARSTNTGFHLDVSKMKKPWAEGLAQAVVNPGHAPIVVDRVAARVTAPWLTGLTCRKYDFSRQLFAQGPVGSAFVVTAAEPLFYARLTRP
ncbi:MAG: hypothetical protein WC708_03810 [Lentisphaeria bacterium]